MSEPDYLPLPRVEQIDINHILPEDIIDAAHIDRWHRLMDTNPVLAHEILWRAREIATQPKSPLEQAKAAIDLSTFVLDALSYAIERNRTQTNDDGDGEDQRP